MHKNSIKNNFKFLIRKIFSLTNSEDKNYKLLTILGITIKIRRIPKKYKLIKHVPHKFELPAFQKPLVSIIIPVYNQYKYTERCLYSILKTVKDIPYEIIIADDCSTDKTKTIQKYIKNIRVVKTKTNSGFLLNCNNAAKEANGEYIWLLNNDTEIFENTLSSLIETFNKKKDVGAVGSKLIYNNIVLQEAGGIVYSDATGCNYGRWTKLFYNESKFNYLKEVDYCSGCSLLIKKDLWSELGGFDEYFAPAYYDESDLCFRIRQKGLKVYYQPKSELIHYESVSLKNSHDELMRINGEKFIKKWGDTLLKQDTPPTDNFFARDRSFNKKVLLFCDVGLLMPDTNCGNKTSFQYIKMFANMGFNVKYVSLLYNYNSFNNNLQKYADLLEQLGIEIISDKDIYNWLKEYGKYVDYAYLNRPISWEKLHNYIKEYAPKAPIIYYGHDIHYIRIAREAESTNNQNLYRQAKEIELLEKTIWEKADVVTYCSEKEVNIVKSYFPNANAFKIPIYTEVKSNDKSLYDAKERNGLIFVGGYNHVPNIDAMLWFIDKMFPSIKNQIPDIKLYVVGSNPTKELLSKANDSIIVTGFVTDEQLEELYSKVRLAVVPLRYGAGIKGKIIEAIQNKIPVITTNIGIEGINNTKDIITVANTEEEFTNAVINLHQDTKKLNSISYDSKSFVDENFSAENARKIFEGIF